MNFLIYTGLFVALVIGIIFGIAMSRPSKKWIASVIIDPVNPEVNGGVYMVWEKDPHEMVRIGEIKNNQLIQVNVLIADVARKSQEEQGT